MAKPRTGQLVQRRSGWYARVWTVVDGERVRVMRALGTQNKTVAKRKLERLLEADNAKAEDVARPETFAEAAQRVYKARIAGAGPNPFNMRGPRQELAQLERYAIEPIGTMAVTAVRPSDVNSVLDHAKAAGQSRGSVQHLRQRLSNVFAVLRREGTLAVNPVDDAEMPKFSDSVIKERAVVTDAELAVYLAWEPDEDRFKSAVRERQTMACMARMFGGLRTGDLHALTWEAFETDAGAFTWGYAPRQKTRRPQLLEVPEMLRPVLRDHWERAGRPTSGLVFPVRSIGKLGDRVGLARGHGSHAWPLRRDLQRAFVAAVARNIDAPKEGSQRWRELFEETDYTLQVDFHSFRRAFAQALGDADVNAQTAAALTGHADLGAHARYLRNAGKLRKLPEAALPDLRFLPAQYADERALAKGRGAVSGGPEAFVSPTVDTETPVNTAHETPEGAFPCCMSRVRIPLPAQRLPELGAVGGEAEAGVAPNMGP